MVLVLLALFLVSPCWHCFWYQSRCWSRSRGTRSDWLADKMHNKCYLQKQQIRMYSTPNASQTQCTPTPNAYYCQCIPCPQDTPPLMYTSPTAYHFQRKPIPMCTTPSAYHTLLHYHQCTLNPNVNHPECTRTPMRTNHNVQQPQYDSGAPVLR